MEKISYERRVYKSVDVLEQVLGHISKHRRKTELMQQRVIRSV